MYLRNAIAIDEDNYPALERLADILYLLGKEEESNHQLQLATSIKKRLNIQWLLITIRQLKLVIEDNDLYLNNKHKEWLCLTISIQLSTLTSKTKNLNQWGRRLNLYSPSVKKIPTCEIIWNSKGQSNQ